ncbi:MULTISPECIES: phosphate/phosphite/phosphonate ABC transporter substrate-binding protein [Silvimonas]|uniref:phosphate/phosphite/phosphonate ABC transporter substrate-binding protein n=1 Tax=Silvimonas TaxID=300264 RepID=UPI0024B32252|nr:MULTISPECIES: PhnD/SsuA/transferrin family substrate-binding protein [Silvimonas]MDR3429365.1 PhnD/SsuA/transferrin family substrate-binding protein [Silvimonas sp.]
MIAALPMYSTPANDALPRLWHGLAGHLRAHGVAGVPDALTHPINLHSHWRDPDLLLSQTCGYPLMTSLAGKVQLVGVFCYDAPGCEGAYYRSLLIVRADDTGHTLADFRGRIAAYNALESQSGYNSLRALIAPLAEDGRFFAQAIASGSHAASIELVRAGQADIAAIDCVSLALRREADPAALHGIRILGQTAAAPGLPLITSASTPAHQLQLLRQGLAAAIADPHMAAAWAAFGITGFEVLPLAAYAVILQMQQQAFDAGYSQL